VSAGAVTKGLKALNIKIKVENGVGGTSHLSCKNTTNQSFMQKRRRRRKS
jgi:hypothetical protein